MDTVTLNHLAEAFVTVYGTEPDQQTPPGAARDEQHDVGGVPDDQPAIFTGYWAVKHFGNLLEAGDLPCLDSVPDLTAVLAAALTEALVRWPERPYDETHRMWEIVFKVPPQFSGAAEYFSDAEEDESVGRVSAKSWIVRWLAPLVVRHVLEGRHARRLVELEAARVALDEGASK
jgi:hypothetical protein